MLKESDILYEVGNHWVLRVATGFEVYRNQGTHSVRCAQIGFKGHYGRAKAIEEANRREDCQMCKEIKQMIRNNRSGF